MASPNESPFQMIRQLGTGRVGDVWVAQQRTRGGITRLVAVKIVHEAWEENSEVVQRMKDEGQVLSVLQHPSIVGFHEVTRIDGRLALVTEYVEGESLALHCTPATLLPARVAVDIAGRIASALEWALSTTNPKTGRPLALIHRDVKPPNIHLADQGEVKLLDFGLARSSEMQRHAKTRMGEVLGSPGYAAPEALAFQVASPAGDVYSLGVTLFEMLVGEPFFMGLPVQDQAMLALQSRDYGAFLASRLPLVQHPDLRVLLDEMLTYQPEKRPKIGTVCDVCEDQVRQMSGPTFSEWNRARVQAAQGPRAPVPVAARLQKDEPEEAPTNKLLVGAVLAVSAGVLLCGLSAFLVAVGYILTS